MLARSLLTKRLSMTTGNNQTSLRKLMQNRETIRLKARSEIRGALILSMLFIGLFVWFSLVPYEESVRDWSFYLAAYIWLGVGIYGAFWSIKLQRYLHTPAFKNALYEAVAEEINKDGLQSGLWARALAASGGSEATAKAFYLRCRAKDLLTSMRADVKVHQPPRPTA